MGDKRGRKDFVGQMIDMAASNFPKKGPGHLDDNCVEARKFIRDWVGALVNEFLGTDQVGFGRKNMPSWIKKIRIKTKNYLTEGDTTMFRRSIVYYGKAYTLTGAIGYAAYKRMLTVAAYSILSPFLVLLIVFLYLISKSFMTDDPLWTKYLIGAIINIMLLVTLIIIYRKSVDWTSRQTLKWSDKLDEIENEEIQCLFVKAYILDKLEKICVTEGLAKGLYPKKVALFAQHIRKCAAKEGQRNIQQFKQQLNDFKL